MHPGPINRGVEIDSEVADGSQSVILDQVTNGLAVRMAVLYLCGGIATHDTRLFAMAASSIRQISATKLLTFLSTTDKSFRRSAKNQQSEIEDRRHRAYRRAGLDRHARASARAGIWPQRNNRIRHARSGSWRIHDDCLHAEYFSGGGHSEHDCLDQRSRGEQRVRECLADGRDFKRPRGRGTRADCFAQAGRRRRYH